MGKNYMLPSITYIVNLSILTNKFPTEWRVTKIFMLYKKKEVTNPENYRPISLLSSDSKITEQAIYLQLVQYLENNNLIHPAHHGFSSGHKTTTALLQMHDQWIVSCSCDWHKSHKKYQRSMIIYRTSWWTIIWFLTGTRHIHLYCPHLIVTENTGILE